MKQIVLFLLFIFTLQKKIHTDIPKVQQQAKGSSFQILPSQDCPSGYFKHCFVKGMYVKTKILPQTCIC